MFGPTGTRWTGRPSDPAALIGTQEILFRRCMKEMHAATRSPEMVEVKECQKRRAREIGDMGLREDVNVD